MQDYMPVWSVVWRAHHTQWWRDRTGRFATALQRSTSSLSLLGMRRYPAWPLVAPRDARFHWADHDHVMATEPCPKGLVYGFFRTVPRGEDVVVKVATNEGALSGCGSGAEVLKYLLSVVRGQV